MSINATRCSNRSSRSAKFHVVRDIGHWVQYEGADEFNRVLLDWLETD